MKIRAAAALALILLASCASRPSNKSVPGHGAIRIEITPNPIVATKVSGDTYEFPFEVLIREIGGRPVEITRVSADVYALGGTLRIANETYDGARIRSLGYATAIPANGQVRYRFSERRSVPDDRLFGNVSADLRVDGRDDAGTPTTATTTVTVRR